MASTIVKSALLARCISSSHHCAKRSFVKPTPFVSIQSRRGCVFSTKRTVRVQHNKDAEDMPSAIESDVQFEIPEALTETLDKVSAAWENTEDKPAVLSLVLYVGVALVAAAGVLKGVDKLPFVPFFLELVGICFSGWFTYRYLLFKPDREELGKKFDKLKNDIL
mmetsp:Transcript_39753/g.55199  ORF Transcript_39753/g.55199 Transcript_39753/m.55199 type:complete len:165 (+) Transcript_39753:85-579(+)|eukprot:CAMPEP_0196579480 /NCGR_PEP_ID=MMETSP1081-20130531/22023_1 /TAXON_ID=36882 /ORGANISM="Pyramimonas amylifera, Strain CCMP720" /LENGTH=164 /DNA_ID=CAMNT_0041899087 /DNA_START=85 /DNA_END=579 /DNA_ORIENTATION=+